VDLFKGTVFFTLVGISTIITVLECSLFLKEKGRIRKSAESFKRGSLSIFIEAKEKELSDQENYAWSQFFAELGKYQTKPKDQQVIESIGEDLEDLSNEIATARGRSGVIERFKHRMESIDARWRRDIRRTVSAWFAFVIIAGILNFVLGIRGDSFLRYLGQYEVYFWPVAMLFVLVLFGWWASHAYRFFMNHYFGDIEELAETDQNLLLKSLDSKFERYATRVQRQFIVSEITRTMVEQPQVFGPFRIVVEILRAYRRAKRSYKRGQS